MTSLEQFDESCARLRTAFAECVRRRRLYDRRANALEAAWLVWLSDGKRGTEPVVSRDDDVACTLSAAHNAATRKYTSDVHFELLSTYDTCAQGTVRDHEDVLQWWQRRVLEWLEPQLREAIGVPVRMAFGSEYPECLQMIVRQDVMPNALNKAAAILDGVSSGALRFCANVVDNDALLEGDPESFNDAMEQSWSHCIATVQHEAAEVAP